FPEQRLERISPQFVAVKPGGHLLPSVFSANLSQILLDSLAGSRNLRIKKKSPGGDRNGQIATEFNERQVVRVRWQRSARPQDPCVDRSVIEVDRVNSASSPQVLGLEHRIELVARLDTRKAAENGLTLFSLTVIVGRDKHVQAGAGSHVQSDEEFIEFDVLMFQPV